MKFILIIASLIFLEPVFPYKFVLLDPDDPDLIKHANESIKDPETREKSLKIAKFRKWLKYDVDCNFIPRPELESRIMHGRCPIEVVKEKITTTTKKPRFSFFKTKKRKPVKKTETGLFSHDSKANVVRMIVGTNKMKEIDLTPSSDVEIEILEGSMITLKCDEANRIVNESAEDPEIIDWFVNSVQVKTSWFDWRVSIAQDGRFGIWPIEEGDSGHFECYVDGKIRASMSVRVVSMSKALIAGLFNYLCVCGIFGLPVIIISFVVGIRNSKDEKKVEVDRMEEFLAEHVFKTDEMAKNRVIDIMNRQKVVDDRQMLENRSEGNRSTIRLMIQNPNLVKSQKNKLKNLESTTTTTNTNLDDQTSHTHTTSSDQKIR